MIHAMELPTRGDGAEGFSDVNSRRSQVLEGGMQAQVGEANPCAVSSSKDIWTSADAS